MTPFEIRWISRAKRCSRAALLGLVLVLSLAAAEPEGRGEKTKSGLSPTLELVLLWANFAILIGGLTYLGRKYGSPFLAARSQKISEDIVEAARVRKDAEARAADVDRRLANLESDLAAMRAESQMEIESQQRHVAERSAAEMAKIAAHAQQEIEAAGKLARLDLKRYSAELALSLAEQKLQARMTPGTQDDLVRRFVTDLDHPPAANAQTN